MLACFCFLWSSFLLTLTYQVPSLPAKLFLLEKLLEGWENSSQLSCRSLSLPKRVCVCVCVCFPWRPAWSVCPIPYLPMSIPPGSGQQQELAGPLSYWPPSCFTDPKRPRPVGCFSPLSDQGGLADEYAV